MSKQLPLQVHDWVTGSVDRSGVAAYTHLVRSVNDSPELTREERRDAPGGNRPNRWRSEFGPATRPKWREQVLELLADGEPRTFNRIVLELTGRFYTADRAFEKAPDHALWDLVADSLVEHTIDIPIVFRRRAP